MRAEVVLGDCRKALDMIEDVRDEQEFRVHWVALVALLRAVGHVLKKVDAAPGSALQGTVRADWSDWQQNRREHSLFWDFINAERNSVLKAYETSVHSGDVQALVQQAGTAEVFALDDCIFTPLLDGPFAGEDGRDVARDAIAWWERQLSDIRSAAESTEAAQQPDRQPPDQGP